MHLGVVGGDGVRESLRMVVLPAFGGDTMRPALALAQRGDDVHDPGGQLVRCGLQTEALVGEQRGQRFEVGAVPGLLRVDPIDGRDLEQGVVLLVVTRGAHLAGDLVATAQFEAPDLGQGHVDVGVGLGVALRAQEAVAVGQDVQQTGAEVEAAVLGLLIEDLPDEILLGVLAEVLDAQLSGHHVQVGEELGLDLGQRGGLGRRAAFFLFLDGVHSRLFVSFI